MSLSPHSPSSLPPFVSQGRPSRRLCRATTASQQSMQWKDGRPHSRTHGLANGMLGSADGMVGGVPWAVQTTVRPTARPTTPPLAQRVGRLTEQSVAWSSATFVGGRHDRRH